MMRDWEVKETLILSKSLAGFHLEILKKKKKKGENALWNTAQWNQRGICELLRRFVTEAPAASQPACFCTPSATSCTCWDPGSAAVTSRWQSPLRCPERCCSDHRKGAGPAPAPGFSLGRGKDFTDIQPTSLALLPPGALCNTVTVIMSSRNR